MRLPSYRHSLFALAITVTVSVAGAVSDLHHRHSLALARQTDFNVYYTAARMVSAHRSDALYAEAGTGENPQIRQASRSSAIAQQAAAAGIPQIQLYVYPPLLADLLFPFRWVGLGAALWSWRLLNIAAVCASAAMIARMHDLSGRAAWLVFGCLWSFSPLWQGLQFGQISLLLFLLWTAALLAWSRDLRAVASVLLGVAVLIKLTPALVVVPLVVWRAWRPLAWLGGTVLVGTAAMCVVNTPGVLLFFATHVIPPMTPGIVQSQNQTINALVQMFWCHGHPYDGMVVPRWVLLGGQALSVVVVLAAAALTLRMRRRSDERVTVLAAFALLSFCVSPLAWIDGLVVGFPLLAALWVRLLRTGGSMRDTVLLALGSVSLGASLGIKHLHRVQGMTLVEYAPLLVSLGMVFYALDLWTTQPLRLLRKLGKLARRGHPGLNPASLQPGSSEVGDQPLSA